MMGLARFDPKVHPEIQSYWDAVSDRKLLVGHCRACGDRHFYPRSHCPFCFSDETELVEVSGRGTIYSFTVNRNKHDPFILAYVTLEEGSTLLTRIVESDETRLRIGSTVELRWTELSGRWMPTFAMVEQAPSR